MDDNFDDGSFRETLVTSIEDVVDTVILYSEVNIDVSSDEFKSRKRTTINEMIDVVFDILDDVKISEIEKRITLISGIALISLEKGYLFDDSKLGQLLETMG